MTIKLRDNLIEEEMASKRAVRSTIVAALIILVVFGAIFYYRTFVYLLIDVSGPSMMNTIQDGDLVVANREATPQSGDIIVFYSEDSDKVLIKRVIGVPGDTVYTDDGYVYIARYDSETQSVETIRLDEDYVMTDGITYFAPVTVGAGEYFVLGDNRGNSSDSRKFGTISRDDVLGVVTEWSLKYKDTFLANFYRLF